MFVVFIPITIGELKSGVCRWRNVWKTIFLVYSFCSSSIFLCIKTKWFIFQCIIFFGFSMLWYVTLVIVTLEKIKRKCTFNRLLSIYLFFIVVLWIVLFLSTSIFDRGKNSYQPMNMVSKIKNSVVHKSLMPTNVMLIDRVLLVQYIIIYL